MAMSMVSAVTCTQSSISKTWNSGESTNAVTFSCTNPANASTVTVSKLGSYFSLSPASHSIGTIKTSTKTSSINVEFS